MSNKLLRIAAVVVVLLAVASVVFFCVKSAQKNTDETQKASLSETTVPAASETEPRSAQEEKTKEPFSEIQVPEHVQATIRDDRAVITMAGEVESIVPENPENYTDAEWPSAEVIVIE